MASTGERSTAVTPARPARRHFRFSLDPRGQSIVEFALTLHPLVEASAVVGVPDPVWGERGVAFVVPVAGAALSVDEVLAHARRNLASFKVPVRVEFVDSLPRSTIEKLARARLRARARRLVEGVDHEALR